MQHSEYYTEHEQWMIGESFQIHLIRINYSNPGPIYLIYESVGERSANTASSRGLLSFCILILGSDFFFFFSFQYLEPLFHHSYFISSPSYLCPPFSAPLDPISLYPPSSSNLLPFVPEDQGGRRPWHSNAVCSCVTCSWILIRHTKARADRWCVFPHLQQFYHVSLGLSQPWAGPRSTARLGKVCSW